MRAATLADASVDAAMALLSVHHWDAQQEPGVRELRRVARGPVVILTYDPRVSAHMWLMAEYLREVTDLDTGVVRGWGWATLRGCGAGQ